MKQLIAVLMFLSLAGCTGRSEPARRPGDLPEPGEHEPSDSDPPTCGPLAQLIGYWPMDAIDVNAGSLLDRSGNNHHGTLTGDPPPVVAPGRVGEALDYSATTVGYVDLPALPVSSGAGASTTVSLWFFRDGPTVDDVLLYLPPGPGTGPPRYDLWLTTRQGVASLCINTGGGDCWGVADASLLGRWVHVVVVFANGPTVDGALYVDGAPVSMTCVFGTCDKVRVVQAPVTLGGSDASYSFHGKLDDVRVFDRAVTADEAMSLYACAQ